jgi:hypothetical protein
MNQPNVSVEYRRDSGAAREQHDGIVRRFRRLHDRERDTKHPTVVFRAVLWHAHISAPDTLQVHPARIEETLGGLEATSDAAVRDDRRMRRRGCQEHQRRQVPPKSGPTPAHRVPSDSRENSSSLLENVPA